jgi:flagellar motor protein MotB
MTEHSPYTRLALALCCAAISFSCGPSALERARASELAELRQDLAELRQYNQDLRLRLQLAEARNKVLIDLVQGLTTDPDHYAPARRQLATADASLNALERDVNALVSTVRHSRSDVTALQSQRTLLQEELAQAKRTISEARAAHAETDARLATLRAVITPLIEPIRAGKINVSVQYGQLVLQLPEEALFEGKSAQLSAAGKPLLESVAQGLKSAPERQARVLGPADHARQLNEARVLSVIAYLTTHGVQRESLSPASQAVAIAQSPAPQSTRFFEITLVPEQGDRAVQPTTEQLLEALQTPTPEPDSAPVPAPPMAAPDADAP